MSYVRDREMREPAAAEENTVNVTTTNNGTTMKTLLTPGRVAGLMLATAMLTGCAGKKQGTVVFHSNRDGNFDLYVMADDGGGQRRLTDSPTYEVSPVWSPDGSRIAASTAVTAGGKVTDPKVYLFDAARTDQDAVPTLPKPPSYFIAMSWSPDGRFLAGQERWATKGLFLYSFEKETFERLTDYGEWPAWLDDRRIIFVSRGKEFLLLDIRTKEVRPIFSVERDVIGPPRLTRDGRVYFSRRVTEADIWMATMETSEVR